MTQPPYGQRSVHYTPVQPPTTAEAEAQKAGFFRAGKVALWVWVVITLVPIVLILACCGFCGLGSVIGAATPAPSPSY